MTGAELVDPVLARICGAAVAVVLLLGAWAKLKDLEVFEVALDRYRLLPGSLSGVVARVLPVVEAGAGAALLFELSRGAGGVAALGLLAVVTCAVAVNLLRGRNDIDCGCGGPDSRQTLSWGLVVRNLLLMLATWIGMASGAARALVWMDYLTVAAGTLALLGLYAAANQLLSNAPRLAGLRN